MTIDSTITTLLIPKMDEEFLDREVLKSFAAIKNKTMATLYGDNNDDKSPKGSVDDRIVPLVDLMNRHDAFATLSSCSGRITLFDPNNANEKGGGWLLSSHDKVDTTQGYLSSLLLREEQQQQVEHRNSLLAFKFEPLLLHVACHSLERGRQLLNVALQMGFRESGLVLGGGSSQQSRRVMVAIRTTGLSLSVPMARNGPLRPPSEYLDALVKDCNRRMDLNLDKLQRLYNGVEEALFYQGPPPSLLISNNVAKPDTASAQFHNGFKAVAHELASLNLWGHVAVAISSNVVYVFGGYGRGPNELLNEDQEATNKSVARSNQVYRLMRNDNGVVAWPTRWEKVQVVSKHDIHSVLGVPVTATGFTPRTGLDGFMIDNGKRPHHGDDGCIVVALWGGREGPDSPCSNSELLLFDSNSHTMSKPTNTRGEPPTPRWGHQFTLLCLEYVPMAALLTGGCNATGALKDSVYMLSLVRSSTTGTDSYFLWESISVANGSIIFQPRFHHCVTAVTDEQGNNVLFVFGGLYSTETFLEDELSSCSDEVSVWSLDEKNKSMKQVCVTEEHGVPCLFGSSACCLTVSEAAGMQHALILTGGVPRTMDSIHTDLSNVDDGSDAGALYSVTVSTQNGNALELYSHPIPLVSDHGVDFGSMVHHSCLPLPGGSGIMLLGGGVSSFAFGPTFARSYLIQLLREDQCATQPSTAFQGSRQFSPTEEISSDTTNIDRPTAQDKVETDCLFCLASSAKSLKVALEEANLLDKRYKMNRVEQAVSPPLIAVPVTLICLQELQGEPAPPWKALVVDAGRHEVSFSAAYLGKQKRKT